MSKKIIFVKSNSLDIDVRVPKETKVLLDNGFDVTFLGWNREPQKEGPKISYHQKIDQVHMDLKSPYGKKTIFYLPIWLFFEFFLAYISPMGCCPRNKF